MARKTKSGIKKFVSKNALALTILTIGIIGIAVFSGTIEDFIGGQVTTPTEPGANYYEVDATVKFTMANLLNGSSVIDGTLTIYDPADPGVALDAPSVSSGTVTTTIQFHTGRVLGIQYSGSSYYYDYSWEIAVPSATAPELVAVTYTTVLKVLAKADYTADTDFGIDADNTEVWDGSAAAVDAFKPDTDDDPIMAVTFVQEDGNMGYGYPTEWKDYSMTVADLQMRGTYALVEFALNASGTTMTNVNDYLKFVDLGGCTKHQWGTSVFLVKRLDTEYLCGYNDDDVNGNTERGLTGIGYFLEVQFDFNGAISGTAWTDEISIQFTLFANHAIAYTISAETLTQSGDTPIGWEGSHYAAADRLTMG